MPEGVMKRLKGRRIFLINNRNESTLCYDIDYMLIGPQKKFYSFNMLFGYYIDTDVTYS